MAEQTESETAQQTGRGNGRRATGRFGLRTRIAKRDRRQPDFSEIGVTGLNRRFGRIHEEFLEQLSPRKRHKIYKQMARNDQVISGALTAQEVLMMQAPWWIEPADPEDADEVEKATFVEGALFEDMSQSWDALLQEIASMFQHGFSAHEIVYKRREGDHREPGKRSQFDDGRIGWRKFAPRAQDTIEEWRFDDHGGVQGFVQVDPNSHEQLSPIPIQKALLFRTTEKKGNPEGVSPLRGAFRAWFEKKELREIEGIAAEREMTGLPVGRVPAEYFSPDADADEKAAKNAMEDIVTGVRMDEQGGVVIPYSGDEITSENVYDFKLVSAGGQRSIDLDQIIKRKDRRMAIAMMADWLLLGSDSVGSFALASSKTRMFSMALGGYMDRIAEVFNRHAIPRLLRINGIDTTRLPQLQHGDVEKPDLAELGLFIKRIVQSGAAFDQAIEERVRQMVVDATGTGPASKPSAGSANGHGSEGGGDDAD